MSHFNADSNGKQTELVLRVYAKKRKNIFKISAITNDRE